MRDDRPATSRAAGTPTEEDRQPSASSDAEPLRLLVVEHDRADAELCVHALKQSGLDVSWDLVETADDLSERLATQTYDLVLSDYRLVGWTGMEALTMLRQRGLDAPFILVTGTLGEENAVECLKQGVDDYVVKQNMARLPMAVRRALAAREARIDRARAEQLIRKLTLAVDQGPASVIITDTNGRIEYVNRRFVEITGYTPEQAVGRTPRILRSRETPLAVYEALWRTILSGQVWHGELLNRRKSGDLYWDSATISPLRDESGMIKHFVAIQEDISERREAERRRHESEARFRQLAENIPEVFFVSDVQFRETLYINPAYEAIWGRTCQSLYENPRSFIDPIAPEGLDAMRANIARVQAGDRPGPLEFRIIRPDGEVRWISSTAVPVRNENGNVYRISGVALDITERRRLEEQFRQAQKMEAVGRLAGGVAHDFNNMLTVITAYASMLYDTFAQSDPRRDDIDEIRKAAAGAASLTRQLLAFSRQQVIEPRLVDLGDVVENAQKMLRRLIGEDVELVTARAAEPAIVLIDPGQLEQVIMNLAVNARDAMPAGGQITIETATVELDDDYAKSHFPATAGRFALLAISDTGIGMDESTRARVFEPFFTTKETGKGTGLGLATVYGIVKQNRGFIWVYTEPGAGSTFKIYLPIATGDAEKLELPTARAEAPRGTECVLIAEDSSAVRTATRQILERYGYTVLEAASGTDALEIAASPHAPIDLLLTDVVMPGISGRLLAERFVELRPGVKVLYMSGYADDAVVRHGVLSAGAAFLQKPFGPEVLARKIRAVLDS